MIFLTLEQLLEIHSIVIEATGGSTGLRDLGRLESAIATQTQNVFGEELYPKTQDKAAALIRAIIADHPFVDGNKRSAMLIGITFLEINDTRFKAQVGEIEDFAVLIATSRMDIPEIAKWLSDRIN